MAYQWPGNVRELANILERAVVMDNAPQIGPEHLLIEYEGASGRAVRKEGSLPPIGQKSLTFPVGTTLQELEKRMIIETLETQNNNRTKTAEILGISIRTLRNKLHEYEKASSIEPKNP